MEKVTFLISLNLNLIKYAYFVVFFFYNRKYLIKKKYQKKIRYNSNHSSFIIDKKLRK